MVPAEKKKQQQGKEVRSAKAESTYIHTRAQYVRVYVALPSHGNVRAKALHLYYATIFALHYTKRCAISISWHLECEKYSKAL